MKTTADAGRTELLPFRKRGRAGEEAAARGGGGGGAAEGRGRDKGARDAAATSPGRETSATAGGLGGARSGPGARPGAQGLRGGARRGRGGAGGAAVPLQVAPRDAILDRSGAPKRAAGGRNSRRRDSTPTPLT